MAGKAQDNSVLSSFICPMNISPDKPGAASDPIYEDGEGSTVMIPEEQKYTT